MQVLPPELRQLVLLGESQVWPHQGFAATIPRPPVTTKQKPEDPPEEV